MAYELAYELAPWVPPFVVGTLKIAVGPLAGALVGALTAQGIAKRNADVQRQLDELRATNAAVSAAVSIADLAATFKDQQVRSMKETYDKLSDARDAWAAGPRAMPFHFQADLEALPAFRAAIPMLEKLIYERINSSGAVLALFALIAQSAASVGDAVELRNTIVDELKARSPVPPDELADIYFGLVTAQGHADSRFRSAIEALASHVDGTLFGAYALAKELSKHAQSLAVTKATRFRKPAQRKGFPQAAGAKFGPLEEGGLLPPLDADWEKYFAALKIDPGLPKQGT
ncbi:MAG: hypothetical protein V4656_17180 [Pseudomonadota bacterium]